MIHSYYFSNIPKNEKTVFIQKMQFLTCVEKHQNFTYDFILYNFGCTFKLNYYH